MSEKEIDEVSGIETTGHEWDGIKELNNPLPRWWLWTFYGCIIWALGYTVLYPAWPLLSSATTGVLGYSSRADLAAKLVTAKAAQGDLLSRIETTEVADIVGNEELARFARAGGRSAFKVYCSQCHGTGAEGAAGYPNLNDDDWLWGGTVDQIYATISHGVRSTTDADTRFNEMPNFGTDALLTNTEIDTVAKQIASLSGIEGGVASPEGAQLFADNCAACHGDTGTGNAELGGPSLADPIWLYGGTLDAIKAQVQKPRHGMMPAWSTKLGDPTVKQLAVYVHGLGGGQ
ncbi:MAG: cytochrome-c oxidase, cbb3-type subunit III [Devosia sp.]|nr:cytochrome-c oxidase, cbb3-type subunit III [Devosia sp.]